MTEDIHLIYIAFIVALTACSIVLGIFAKGAGENNRNLRRLYTEIDSRHRRVVRRLDIFTCNACMDRPECKHRWDYNNIRGNCVRDKLRKGKKEVN